LSIIGLQNKVRGLGLGVDGMKRALLVMVIVCSLLSVSFVSAGSPTQQYSKIYIDPYYRESMNDGVWYNYQVTVDPPDGISEVINAIIGFSIFLTPTVEFTLKVNNQSCNNPYYLVHTTYASTEYAGFSFDCSNIIIGPGVYNISLMSSKNTGASNAWLDLTYMNNPPGTMEVSGTGYQVGDMGTIFLQLRDDQGLPVNDGACYLDIYYPYSYNASHDLMLQSAPMIFKEEGVYYYDLLVPNYTGVYMAFATCSYAFDPIWIYPSSESTKGSDLQEVSGTCENSTVALNDYDKTYIACSGSNIELNFTFDVDYYGNLTNVTDVELYFSGEAEKETTLTFSYWNGTAFVDLPNTLTMYPSGASVIYPSGVDHFASNSIPLDALLYNGAEVILKLTYTGNNIDTYLNWFSLRLLTAEGTVQELKGSSEMHVSEKINLIWDLLTDIWDWLTNTLWSKILGMEQTLNETYNKTLEIKNDTETIIEKIDALNYSMPDWGNANFTINATIRAVGEIVNQSYIQLFGTEYQSGEAGKSFVQAVKGGSTIDTATCTLTVYYPNTSLFLNAVSMNAVGSDGFYYYDFTVPDIKGIYMATAYCQGGGLGTPQVSSNEWHIYTAVREDQMSVIS